jgi:hypothetical protein
MRNSSFVAALRTITPSSLSSSPIAPAKSHPTMTETAFPLRLSCSDDSSDIPSPWALSHPAFSARTARVQADDSHGYKLATSLAASGRQWSATLSDEIEDSGES